jgi:hypothetical protein
VNWSINPCDIPSLEKKRIPKFMRSALSEPMGFPKASSYLFSTKGQKEGLTAFVEKRKPTHVGITGC